MNRVGGNPLDGLVGKKDREQEQIKVKDTVLKKKEKSNRIKYSGKYRKYPLNMPVELHAKIKGKAFTSGRTMNELILYLIEKGLR